MKNINTDPLSTPVYLKTEGDDGWPKDKMFYVLSKNGLFICRNHPWFQSCSPAKKGPGDLGDQKEFCNVSYPLIPRVLIEKAVGFFHRIDKEKDAESAVILAFNRQTDEIELICPEQECSWGSVKYDTPTLPPHMALIGDIHSHPGFSPTPSGTDKDDEWGRPGLHIVVGKLDQEPPEFYCGVVVDGQRYEIADHSAVFEDYIQRDTTVPDEWIGKVKKKEYEYMSYSGGGDWHGGSGDYKYAQEPSREDKKIMKNIIGGFKKKGLLPSLSELRQALFSGTKCATYLACEKRASDAIASWPQIKEHYEKLIGKE